MKIHWDFAAGMMRAPKLLMAPLIYLLSFTSSLLLLKIAAFHVAIWNSLITKQNKTKQWVLAIYI
jgi:hypothetical protein